MSATLIWADPGEVENLDFAGGPGGRDGEPKPPFTFIEESLSGANPKVRVSDAKGVKWTVKFGSEVNAETLATRVAWAAGYFVEPNYFIPIGRVEKLGNLTRAKKYIKADGSFTDARFEIRHGKGVKKLDGAQSWSWILNPFVNSVELKGLKVIMMLTSNFDNKDVRDPSRGGASRLPRIKNECAALRRPCRTRGRIRISSPSWDPSHFPSSMRAATDRATLAVASSAGWNDSMRSSCKVMSCGLPRVVIVLKRRRV